MAVRKRKLRAGALITSLDQLAKCEWAIISGELSKPTDIWGYFNPPTPTVKEKPEIAKYLCNGRANTRKVTPVSYANPKTPPEYASYISQFTNHARRAAIRAITPAGFAEAFYRANKH
ncbi:MAG: hypothetical protein LBJ84_07450 [Oscillospiraceae bacterium]|jgi:hypothetical protein|nr:hypothetical protein [Oscillospiraceae bacterium]